MDVFLRVLSRQVSNDTESIPISDDDVPDPVPAHHANAVVAFIIGLAIVILASVLNAAGLNLTKLDHVRSSAVPKSARKKDWARPLWLLGMTLYIISQLIGSTLALEYMRAEYVAPLGSTSLIFNFLFARFLVGTPVTWTDIYGTVVVILGVIGIVAFGSINTGLSTETDARHLSYLWGRGGWLGFFIVMSLALVALYIFTSQLELVLTTRADLSAEPFAGMTARMPRSAGGGLLIRAKERWDWCLVWIAERLEEWTAGKDDKVVAWTLGIGWACCGGGMAGECLVFAKAGVQLIAGSLSHENPGNQIGHAAPIVTFMFLAILAVMQIVCLNRGLKVYDSTLVVPVFYGVYTATGWLNSLIFNDAVDAFASWTLFLIFCSILILISGVVLLTHKKPESSKPRDGIQLHTVPGRPVRKADGKTSVDAEVGGGERAGADGEVVWDVGEASDDEGEGGDATPRGTDAPHSPPPRPARTHSGPEGMHLMEEHEEEERHLDGERPSLSVMRSRSLSKSSYAERGSDEFGAFKAADA